MDDAVAAGRDRITPSSLGDPGRQRSLAGVEFDGAVVSSSPCHTSIRRLVGRVSVVASSPASGFHLGQRHRRQPARNRRSSSSGGRNVGV